MRTLILVIAAVGLACVVAAEDEPAKPTLTPIERLMLEGVAKHRRNAGYTLYQAGKYQEAAKDWDASLELSRRLYPVVQFPGGAPNLAHDLNNLAHLRWAEGKLSEAESLYEDALAMLRRLHRGDDADTAFVLNSLGVLYKQQKKYADAEPLYKESLAMRKRLFKEDHVEIASSLTNLAILYLQSEGQIR